MNTGKSSGVLTVVVYGGAGLQPGSYEDDMAYADTLRVFESLRAGDRIRLRHKVKVGFRQWHTETVGKVVTAERRRHSLHFNRNYDDKVYSDVIVLELDNGELTTVTLDEFSELEKLASAENETAAAAAPEAGQTAE